MTMTIRDRILARRDLDHLRAARDLDGLAAGLNTECQSVLVPVRVNAAAILVTGSHQDVLIDFLQAVANGEKMTERAQELISDDGVEVLDMGFDPPEVSRQQVEEAMYNPDGTEK